MKYSYKIQNLDCANCGNKIEDRLSKEPDIQSVNLNFMLKKLVVEVDTTLTQEEFGHRLEEIANQIEKGVRFMSERDHSTSPVQKVSYTYQLENLHCANCANKIAARLEKESDIQKVELNFMLKKLTLTMETDLSKETIRIRVEALADQIEKGIKLVSNEESSINTSRSESHCHDGCCSTYYHEGYDHREHPHEHYHKQTKKKGFIKPKSLDAILLGLSVVLLMGGALLESNLLFIIAYILVGYDVVIQAIKNCINGRMLDENFLMTIATIAAFIIGEYPEAVAVMLFYKIGEYMQSKAVNYSTREIEKAMDIRPDFARVIREEAKIVEPQAVRIGEIIEVRPGEKLPLDGVIIEGKGTLDTSMLTGESLPTVVEVGDSVLSGSVNKDGVLRIQVTQAFTESTVSKILELIQNASSKKSKAENFITKFARWYTPVVVGLALATAIIPSLITGNWQDWIYTSIVFLVISCPCALVVSVPLGFFAGIGSASRVGVLVKGSNYLEELNTIDAIVLDKTGTITKGEFGVVKIITAQAVQEEILECAAKLESCSNHPIAKSIVKAYGKSIGEERLENYKEVSGEGIVADLEEKQLVVGNEKLMQRYGINFTPCHEIGSHIYVARDGIYLGCIVVADEVKEDSKSAIAALKAQGIKKVIMLTGDKKEIAERIGKEVGVNQVYAELLPQDKVAKLEEVLQTNKVAFVGDGINDAPVLARADIGIAMGGVGSDAAIEASDIVLMTDALSSIGDVVQVAKRTRRIVTQNIVFALGIKVIVLVLGLLGIANMWLAIFADVGVSLLAVMNSIRVLGKDTRHIFSMMKK